MTKRLDRWIIIFPQINIKKNVDCWSCLLKLTTFSPLSLVFFLFLSVYFQAFLPKAILNRYFKQSLLGRSAEPQANKRKKKEDRDERSISSSRIRGSKNFDSVFMCWKIIIALTGRFVISQMLSSGQPITQNDQ